MSERVNVLCKLRKFPEFPEVRELQEGEDPEAVALEMLGGEGTEEDIHPHEKQIGIVKNLKRGDEIVAFHTHPQAKKNLEIMIADAKAKLAIEGALRARGVDIKERTCFCGECGKDNDARESLTGAASSAPGGDFLEEDEDGYKFD